MSEPVKIIVYGLPQSSGSKTGFPFRGKDGRMHVAMSDSNKKAKSWRQEVASNAQQRLEELDVPLLVGPVVLSVVFCLPRPKGHYGTGRNAVLVKAGAPRFPAVKPDLLKLTRTVEDALTGIVWRDDAQIVEEYLRKAYTADGGAHTEIEWREI